MSQTLEDQKIKTDIILDQNELQNKHRALEQ